MGVVNIVTTIKIVHPSCLVMVKIGSFYNTYGKDAYILSYLFKYKIRESKGIQICSFPISSISKVENVLERNNINYIVVNKRNNYEEEQKLISKQENNYEKILDKSNRTVTFMLRIQRIYDMLLEKRDNENIYNKLEKIEKVLEND